MLDRVRFVSGRLTSKDNNKQGVIRNYLRMMAEDIGIVRGMYEELRENLTN